jgi:hypothetical protein
VSERFAIKKLISNTTNNEYRSKFHTLSLSLPQTHQH